MNYVPMQRGFTLDDALAERQRGLADDRQTVP
jgi:hypothetical protein